jgi:Skp family chaperone for outer membrane proteins
MNALREEFPMENDTVGADLRDLRKSVDQKFEKLEAKLDDRFERQDARFDKQDTKHLILVEKMDARFERQDERAERREARLLSAVDARLEAMSTRGLTVWIGVLTAAATIAAAVLANHFR